MPSEMEMTNPFLVPFHSWSGESRRTSSIIIIIIIHWKIKENKVIQRHLQGRLPLGSIVSMAKPYSDHLKYVSGVSV